MQIGVFDKVSFNDIHGKIYYLYFPLSFFACYLTLKQLSGQIAESLCMVFYALLLFSLIRFRINKEKVYAVFHKWWHRMLLLILEAYAAFSVTGMYLLDSSIQYEAVYPDIIYIILSYIWIRPVVIFILAEIESFEQRGMADKEKNVTFGIRLVMIGVILLPCMLFLIGFNPAVTSPDSEYCFDAAHRIWDREFYINDWQPPFYIYTLNILTKICDSVTFIIILQCVYFAVVFVDGILYFYKKGISKRLLMAVYCFISFGISNIIQLVTLWKDIPYMVSMMWLTLLLIKYVMDKEKYGMQRGWYIQMVTAVVFTAMFRQNGVLAAAAVIILLPVVSKSAKTLVISAVSIGLIFFIKGPFYHAMGVDPVPQIKFFALANDLMYCYYKGDPVSEDAMKIINKVTSNDPDHFEYNAYYVNYNSSEPSGYTAVEFMKIYLDNAVRNPRNALMAVLIRNSDIWSIVKPIDEVAGCVNYLGETNTYEEKVYPFRKDNFLTEMLTALCSCITNNSVLFILYWRTGIYHLLMILMMGILVVRMNKRGRMICLFPFAPAVMSLAALFIASGWSDYRYFWPDMAISLLLLCYFMQLKAEMVLSGSETVKAVEIQRIRLR